MTPEEFEIIDKFVTANLRVTQAKDLIKFGKAAHRDAIKDAALADAAYRELIKRREEIKNAAQ